MSLFEKATRRKLRFESERGQLTVEQLWDLPLIARSNFSLDAVGRVIQRQLKSDDEESLVAPSKSIGHSDNVLRLDIIKHIIAVRQAEAAAAKNAESKKEREIRLTQILAEKEDDDLRKMSTEDIRKELGITQ